MMYPLTYGYSSNLLSERGSGDQGENCLMSHINISGGEGVL